MQVSQINGSASFKGRIMDYNTRIGKSDLMNNSYWQKNSSVEDTLGSFRNSTSGKVYFAANAGNDKLLTSETPFTEYFSNTPAEPDGQGKFCFRLPSMGIAVLIKHNF